LFEKRDLYDRLDSISALPLIWPAVGLMPCLSLRVETFANGSLGHPRSFLDLSMVNWHEPALMPLGLDKVREDRFFAQCLARLKPMQTVHQDEALAIAPH
jgi:hypothetical protein